MSKTTLEVIFEVRNRQGPQDSYENITGRLLMRSARLAGGSPIISINPNRHTSDEASVHLYDVKKNSNRLARWLCKQREETHGPTDEETKNCVADHSTSSRRLNNALIATRGELQNWPVTADAEREFMDRHPVLSAFGRSNPATHHHVVYSGLRFDPDEIMHRDQTGNRMISHAYISTTTNPNVAMEFSSYPINGVHHVGVFHIRPGDRAAPIRDLSLDSYKDENETLIGHGQILHRIGQQDVQSLFREHGEPGHLGDPLGSKRAIPFEKRARIRLHHFRLYDPQKSITESKIESLPGIPSIPVPIHFRGDRPRQVNSIPSIPVPIHFNPNRGRNR